VRAAAIALAVQQPVDPESLAFLAAEVIVNSEAVPEQRHAALRWAKALGELQPDKLRSHVLLGGALFRLGQFDEALATLQAAPTDEDAQGPDRESSIAFRQMLLVLIAHHQGNSADAKNLASQLTTARWQSLAGTAASWLVRLYLEIRQTVPFQPSPSLAGASESTFVPDEASLLRRFESIDANGNARLDGAEVKGIPYGNDLLAADADGDGALTPQEFLAGVRALIEIGRIRFTRRLPLDYEAQLRAANDELQRDPDHVQSLNNRAWFLATCSDGQLRNGEQAVVDATRACELTEWKNPVFLDTLAAAYAETGNFDEAVKRQEQALAAATPELRTETESRLALYRDQKPFRLPGRYETIPGWGRSADPLGDCRIEGRDGVMTIHIPPGNHNFSPSSRGADAPRVLQDVDGDFTAEVRVTCTIGPKSAAPGSSVAYHGAGLLVYDDIAHFLRVERNGFFRDWDQAPSFGRTGRTPLSSNAPTVEYWRDVAIAANRNNWTGEAPQLPGDSTWLRITRRGPTVHIELSHDGQAWEAVEPIQTSLPSRVRVGVIAINSSGEEFDAEFSDFKITQP
jgi:regulation of enolase protein 1 (concanavalin A-like superfamily)/tetratricopeptide (TPR) repeat protein